MLKLDLDKGFLYAEGIQRTNLDCTDCHKVFVAKLNFDISGNHEIVCPYCGHKHFRTIKKGVVTGDRWSSQAGPNVNVPTERMWTNESLGAKTTTAANHIRERWLDNKEAE